MEIKSILGLAAVLISFYGYGIYARDIIWGKTKPHSFTWLILAILTTIAFVAQFTNNAGPGAWVTGITAIFSYGFFFAGLKHNHQNIAKSDWFTLFAAITAIPIWLITANPLWSIFIIIIIDGLALYPTFRKSWFRPHEETVGMYTWNGIKFILSIFALQSLTAVNYIYPLFLVVTSFAFVIMVIVRKRQLKNHT